MKAEKNNGSQKERGKHGNLLAALLIELPQHFSRGWSARRLDRLIRIHTCTHMHTDEEKRSPAMHTQIGNASDMLSSIVFLAKFD